MHFIHSEELGICDHDYSWTFLAFQLQYVLEYVKLRFAECIIVELDCPFKTTELFLQ